ncbi:DNA-binding response OmpR family regulator [Brevibacillus nitrificans]|nr:DNA-binding response OmpR family regulator [Brevibacillus nitrificans]
MDKASILLIEDEKKISRFLKLELEYEGTSQSLCH